jgi:cyclopropane fatty-acyl-phospholipid synthase-like methyltransferase
MMAVADARRHYNRGYFHGGEYEDYEAAEPVAKKNFARFANRLARIQANGTLLEVGCAFGYFLDVAQRRWDAYGVDISDDQANALISATVVK